MTQYTWCASLLLAGCAAAMTVAPTANAAAAQTIGRRKPADDASAMATGYIYRKDGNKPAMFVKLGAGSQSDSDSESGRQRTSSRYDKSPYRRPSHQEYTLPKEGYQFQHFGAGSGLEVPSHLSQSDDSPYAAEHADAPAGLLDNGHFSPESGLEDHLEGIEGATRTKHDADDFAGLKSIGDEYKLADDYSGGSHADYHHGWGGHGGGGHGGGGHGGGGHGGGGHGGGGGGGGHGKSYAKGGGSKQSSHTFSIHGSKAGKGHKATKTFGSGDHGVHGSEAHKGHFSGAGTTKKVNHDEAGKYGSHHSNTKGSAEGKHGEKGHGKKGHKATGFHNVYNKDEFKKNTAFYDTNDKGGTHHKGGDHSSQTAGKSGAHKKGGFHGSSFVDGHKGKVSHSDKGKVHKDHKSNKGASGHDLHFLNKETFGKKDAFSSGKKYSHSSKGGGHH